MKILPWRNNEERNRSTQEDKRRHYDANVDSCLPIFDSSRVVLLVLAWTIVKTCSSAFQKYDWFIVRLDSVNCFKKSPGLEKDYWNWHNEHDECRSGSMKSRGIWSCPVKEQFRMIKADSACLKKSGGNYKNRDIPYQYYYHDFWSSNGTIKGDFTMALYLHDTAMRWRTVFK